MKNIVRKDEVFGFLRPDEDAHTLGITYISEIIRNCGYEVVLADTEICKTISNISELNNFSLFKKWIIKQKITRLGFSYRLDP